MDFRNMIKGMLMAVLTVGVIGSAAAQDGDVEAGKRVYRQCQACHAIEEGQNRVGPSLYNVIGRTAGSIEGFRYSPAHKKSGIVWTAETLDPYLENPRTYIPGNRMAFAGLRNPKQRADVIAFLYSISPDAPTGDDAGEAPAEEEEAGAGEDDGETEEASEEG